VSVGDELVSVMSRKWTLSLGRDGTLLFRGRAILGTSERGRERVTPFNCEANCCAGRNAAYDILAGFVF